MDTERFNFVHSLNAKSKIKEKQKFSIGVVLDINSNNSVEILDNNQLQIENRVNLAVEKKRVGELGRKRIWKKLGK